MLPYVMCIHQFVFGIVACLAWDCLWSIFMSNTLWECE